ncbi:uncharacterized protein A4U43_C07F10090 [Asparagus officinalis]|uniref:CW-type domain-containing protein n=2 Tax=Asparagus officinalis TaxID=4686 RepID=A0A5P1EAX7_ASPOF|nr:uncharacterized protein A4U43_C07F10090 [Asparagus officinalis]
MGSMKSGAVSYLGNELTYSKGTNNPKTSFTEKDIEVKNPNNHKDVLSDTRSQGKSKNQKNNDISKLNNGEDKVRNDHTGHVEPMKQMPIQKFIPHEKMLQENDQTQEGKRIQKGSRNNCTSVESMQTQGSLRDSSSVVPKEKKKSSHARHHHSENKSKMKSRKDPNRVHSSKSHRDVVGNISAQRAENKADLSESFAVSEKSISRSGFKQEVDLQPELVAHPPVATSSTCTAPTAAAAVALDAPPSVVIQENWVCCDKCQKWRLLPFGADPNNLPKKWKCSMQVWLSGLNKCGISEEETTKAFHALYLVPAPETGANLNGHHDVAALNATSSTHHFDRRFDHDIQSMSAIGKKKSGLTSASNVPKSSVSKKSHQASVKSRSLTDVTEFPLETNSSGKAGLGLTNKSVDFTAENHKHRQKDKHEISVRQSDGGDFIVKGAKHSKSKSKREASQDGLRTSKKIKKENSSYHVEDRLSDLDMSGRTACKMDNGLAAKVTGKIQQNYSDHSSSKDSKSDLRGNLLESTKKSKDPVRLYSNGDFKDHFNVEKSVVPDYAAKKRKVKEWQESQVHQETVMSSHNGLDSRLYAKEAFSEGERRKQKKAKVPGTGEKEFNTSYVNEKTDKKGRSTKMSLSGHREQRSDGMGDEGRFGMERIGYQEAATSRQALDGTDPPKRDMSYAQLPTAATSSSSKVSSSRRSKANMQEAKGSPVESVSSSPLRSAATEKIFIGRNSAAKDDMVTLDASFMGSPKKSSDADLGSDQSGTRRKETVSSAQLNSLERNRAESGVFASMGGASHHSEKETSHLSGSSNKDGLYSKMVAQVDLSSAELEETNIVDDTEKILDHDNKYIFDRTEKENIDGNGDDLNNHRGSGATSQWKSDNSSSGFKDRNKISNLDANRGKLKVSDTINDRKELYSLKKGINLPSGAEFNYNDNCIPHEGSRDENCNFQEKDEAYLGKKISSAKLPPDRRENHSDNGLEESLDAQHKDFNSRHTFAGASCKSNLQENLELAPSYPSENPMSHSLLSHIDRSDMASGTGMPQPVQPPKGNSEAHNSGAQRVATPVKGSRSDTNPTDAANGDAVKLAKQSRKPANQNGVFSNTLRQNTPNSHDSSPLRKDGPVANTVLKEARVLKHTANRLKNEGLDHESIGLYFQSALKFLYGSSLLEPPSAESGKHGEMNPPAQMISMYSDTAKLCEYCAHEYERYKEMAAAALAYKCVEVAYMKVAYYRNPVASKDRHELQTALQAVVPGESPSSSASDIDNLNNQGALDKAALAKAAGSPQITGTHVIAARNRPAFSRLLTYTNDLNCAFDATKRSQNAIAAAGVNLDKDGVDGISSVRKVIDFNFHNVEELLRLVRLSMELIGR